MPTSSSIFRAASERPQKRDAESPNGALRIASVAGVLPGRDLPGAVVDNVRIAGRMLEARDRLVRAGEAADFPLSTPEFPAQRIGVLERRVLERGLDVRDMAALAGRRALERAGLSPSRVSCVLVSTVTPGRVVPAVATAVAASLGLGDRVLALDVTLGCNGFVGALALAQGLVREPGSAALVIGADAMSRVLDATDRATLPIFGDGAGAVVLTEEGGRGAAPVDLWTLGKGGPRIQIRPVEEQRPVLRMVARDGVVATEEERAPRLAVVLDGQRVFRDIVRALPRHVEEALARRGLAVDDFEHVAFHQANARLIECLREALRIAPERVLMNIASVGNTTSASIPLLLDDAARRGQLSSGDRILLVGFGTGYSLGFTCIQWS